MRFAYVGRDGDLGRGLAIGTGVVAGAGAGFVITLSAGQGGDTSGLGALLLAFPVSDPDGCSRRRDRRKDFEGTRCRALRDYGRTTGDRGARNRGRHARRHVAPLHAAVRLGADRDRVDVADLALQATEHVRIRRAARAAEAHHADGRTQIAIDHEMLVREGDAGRDARVALGTGVELASFEACTVCSTALRWSCR